MFSLQCEELRMNHLTPLLVVTMPYACSTWLLWWAHYIEDFKQCLHFQFWGCVLKGCFERGIF